MIKQLLRGVFSGIALKLLADYRLLSIQHCRIEAAKAYLHGVRMARVSAIGLMRMGVTIGLICLGMLLAHAGLFVLLPWTVKAKAVLGILLGLSYVAIGTLALCASTDEKRWMDTSGATAMLEEALAESRRRKTDA